MADKSDEIKPVAPVHSVETRLHADPSLQVKPRPGQKKPVTEKAAETDGISLTEIPAEKAATLLLLPLMENQKALTLPQFKAFKSGLQRIRDGQMPDDLEYGYLAMADQMVDLLRENRVSDVDVAQFSGQIASIGKAKPVRRG